MGKYIRGVFEKTSSVLNEGMVEDTAKLLGIDKGDAQTAIDDLSFADYLELGNAVDLEDISLANSILGLGGLEENAENNEECWACYGDGIDAYGETCIKCGGKGILTSDGDWVDDELEESDNAFSSKPSVPTQAHNATPMTDPNNDESPEKQLDDLKVGDEIEVVDIDGQPAAGRIRSMTGPGNTIIITGQGNKEHIIKRDSVMSTPKVNEADKLSTWWVTYVTKDSAPDSVPHYESDTVKAIDAKDAKVKGMSHVDAAHKPYVRVTNVKRIKKFMESAPPGMEKWIKDRKASFKKQYGDDWEEVLYATAWKEKNKKKVSESMSYNEEVEYWKRSLEDSMKRKGMWKKALFAADDESDVYDAIADQAESIASTYHDSGDGIGSSDINHFIASIFNQLGIDDVFGWRQTYDEMNEDIVEPAGDTFYHVTFTDKVNQIRTDGLIPKASPTNWVKAGTGERYGEGEVHVFTDYKDAKKWAMNMDWEFNKELGSGNISIITLKSPPGIKWEVDSNDPLEVMTRSGHALKTSTPIEPKYITGASQFTQASLKEGKDGKLWVFFKGPGGQEYAGRIVKESDRFVWVILSGAPTELPTIRVPKSKILDRVSESWQDERVKQFTQASLKEDDDDLARIKKLAGIQETASGGATGAGAIASSPVAMGGMQKRDPSIYATVKKPTPKARKAKDKDGIGRNKKD